MSDVYGFGISGTQEGNGYGEPAEACSGYAHKDGGGLWSIYNGDGFGDGPGLGGEMRACTVREGEDWQLIVMVTR